MRLPHDPHSLPPEEVVPFRDAETGAVSYTHLKKKPEFETYVVLLFPQHPSLALALVHHPLGLLY